MTPYGKVSTAPDPAQRGRTHRRGDSDRAHRRWPGDADRDAHDDGRRLHRRRTGRGSGPWGNGSCRSPRPGGRRQGVGDLAAARAGHRDRRGTRGRRGRVDLDHGELDSADARCACRRCRAARGWLSSWCRRIAAGAPRCTCRWPPSGAVNVAANHLASVTVDVLGYAVADDGAQRSGRYRPLQTPARIYSAGPGGVHSSLVAGQPRAVDLLGVGGVPASGVACAPRPLDRAVADSRGLDGARGAQQAGDPRCLLRSRCRTRPRWPSCAPARTAGPTSRRREAVGCPRGRARLVVVLSGRCPSIG